MTRVLVCGGRDFSDQALMDRVLDELVRDRVLSLVIHGGCRTRDRGRERWVGADYMAGDWARRRGVPVSVIMADWNRYGPPAGPIRNQRLIDELRPELGVAFIGGTGTADMVRRLRRHHVEVIMPQGRIDGQRARILRAAAKDGRQGELF